MKVEIQEVNSKANNIDKLRSQLIKEYDIVTKEIDKQSGKRYELLSAYKEGLRFALDLIDKNYSESEDN